MVNAMIYAGLPSDYQVVARYSVHTGDYEEILTAVCVGLKIDHKALVGKGRSQDVSDARKIAFKLLRELSRMTLVQIGALFNKNYSTVIHALNSYDELHQFDPVFREKVFRVRRLLEK